MVRKMTKMRALAKADVECPPEVVLRLIAAMAERLLQVELVVEAGAVKFFNDLR